MKCELCQREIDKLTVHHLIPKSRIKNKYKKIKEDPNNLLWICRSCHDQIHAIFTNNELRDMYFTKELLLGNNEFKKFVEWKKKHQDFNGHSKMSNNRKKHYG